MKRMEQVWPYFLLLLSLTALSSTAAAPPVDLSPTSLNFGQQTLYTTSGANPATLTNHLNTDLTILSITVTGDFAQSNNCSSVLAAGHSCTIKVYFTPTVIASRTGTLTVAYNEGSSPQMVSLSGTGSVQGLVSVSVTPSNPSVPLGIGQQFAATGFFKDGSTQNLTSAVVWSSSAAGMASISNAVGSQGWASSVGQGVATISATAGSVIGSTILTVKPPALVSLAVTPANPSIFLGKTLQFAAIGSYTDGSTQNLTTSVNWSSSAAGVATVSTQGLATAVTQGTTTITAISGSLVASTMLAVKPPALVSLALTPANPSIPLGTTLQFTVTGSYTDGSTQNLTTSVTWSSSISAVATISNTVGSQGLAKSVGQGATTIMAAAGSVSGSTTLTVNPPAIQSLIAVTPAAISMSLGIKLQFTATAYLTDGSTQNVTTQVTWSSSNPAVATISNSPGTQGLVTSVAQGTTTITATATTVTGHVNWVSTTLTVQPPTLVSITVTPVNPSILLANKLQFTATGNYSDGSTRSGTAGVTWSSSNPAVATISNATGSEGMATAVGVGTTTISASIPFFSGSTTLTVNSQPLVSLTVSPAAVSIPLGDAEQFAATAIFADGSTQDHTTAVAWSSSNAAVATISNSPGTQGRATSVALGTTRITATEGLLIGSTSLMVTTLVPGQARFAYVTNEIDSTISTYRVSGSTGLLTPNGTTSLASGAFPRAVTADPLGKFLYVANSGPPVGNGNITGYAIDSAAGLLTPIPGSSVFAYPVFALAVHPSSQFLFTATGGSVATYRIDTAGVLTFVGQTGALGSPTSVAVDPSGKFVYAANVNNNNLSAFTFDSTTGALAPIPGSPFPAGANPEFVAVHPSGKFLYAPNGNGQSVSAYMIDSTTGALAPIPGSPFAVGIIPMAIAVDPAGKFAYVTNQFSNNVSAFTVDATTGALLPIVGSPFAAGRGPGSPMVDPLSKFLYVVNPADNDVSIFAIDTTSGTLTNLGTAPAGNAPLSMFLVK